MENGRMGNLGSSTSYKSSVAAPPQADFEDAAFQAGLKRAMEPDNAQTEIAIYLAEHTAKR